MVRFLEAQSFTEEEQKACEQFIERFVQQDLASYLTAINAIKCYLDTTMILADREIRDELLQFCDDLTTLTKEVGNSIYFHEDEETGDVALPPFPEVL